jgi:RecA/RadA recombinase
MEMEKLYKIAAAKNIPVLLTNQVYSDYHNRKKARMVGGDLLRCASRCVIELEKNGKTVTARLKKHQDIPTNSEVRFRIVEEGIEGI